MIGLVYKDCMTLKKQLTTLLMFLLAYGALTVAGVFDASILGVLVTVMGMTIPMSSVALDDAARWDRYAVATPAGRRGVVAGKYVFTALVIVVSSIFAVLLMVGLSLAGLSKQTLTENLVVALSCAAVTLLQQFADMLRQNIGFYKRITQKENTGRPSQPREVFHSNCHIAQSCLRLGIILYRHNIAHTAHRPLLPSHRIGSNRIGDSQHRRNAIGSLLFAAVGHGNRLKSHSLGSFIILVVIICLIIIVVITQIAQHIYLASLIRTDM